MTLKDALALVDLEDLPGSRKNADRLRRKYRYENFEELNEGEIDAWFIGTYDGRRKGVREGYRAALIAVAKALSENGQSQTDTAAILGVSQATAHRLLKEPTATETLKARRCAFE